MGHRFLNRLLVLAALILVNDTLSAAGDAAVFDQDQALRVSQAAIGNELTDITFTGTDGATRHLSDYQGKPLVISLVFTSCHLICSVTTIHLKNAVVTARESLGDDSFNVITIGFDTQTDTPENMAAFARQKNITLENWDFLSTTGDKVETLIQELGFTRFPSPRGFDHITQLSLVDRDGKVYRQVYGEQYELPWLVEPLKELVYNRPVAERHFLSDLIARVKLFCTVYDPGADRYRIDYSLFVQILIGLITLVSVSIYLFREARHSKASRH